MGVAENDMIYLGCGLGLKALESKLSPKVIRNNCQSWCHHTLRDWDPSSSPIGASVADSLHRALGNNQT